jgi:hypothetical protein
MGNQSTLVSVPVQRKELVALLDLEARVVCLHYAMDHSPGNDLGATAIALAHADLRAAIKRLANLRGHELSGSLFLSEMLVRHATKLP